MISRSNTDGQHYDYRGLSTDTKPTEQVPNGSSFIEMDSGKVFFYDADGALWREWGA